MFLVLIIITLLILTFVPLPFTNTNISSVQKKGPYKLNDQRDMFDTNKFILNSSVTFQGFVYLEVLQKTGITTLCSNTDNSKPNCNTGRYSLCSCTGTDCSPCKHDGYIPLVNFNDICLLELLGAPDGSRQNKASIQLTIKTRSSGDISGGNPELDPADISGASQLADVYIETFALPPLPFQKWVMITISREGRRFDIYYNSTIVLSKQTSAVVYTNAPNSKIVVGHSKLSGTCGFFTLYDTIQSSFNITSQYNSFVNTRGTPMFVESPPTLGSLDVLPASFGVPSLPSLCPSGDCINSPTSPPANPIYEWSSSYA